jgi:hypothetical protein
VRGRPLWSTAGRGPSLTFGVYPAARSRSRNEGRADWVDIRTSSDGRGNSSRMFLYREYSEVTDSGDRGDVGDMALECDSLGLPRERGERELAREGGGLRSGEDVSTSGEVVEGGGGTMVASDLWLPDRCLVSGLGGGCDCGCDCESD